MTDSLSQNVPSYWRKSHSLPSTTPAQWWTIAALLTAAVLLTVAGLWLWRDSQRNLEQYNASACAATGYQPDCRTPLAQ